MTKTIKKITVCSLSLLMAGTLAAAQIVSASGSAVGSGPAAAERGSIADVTGRVHVDTESLFDPGVVKKLPDTLDKEREISVIVNTTEETVLTAYLAQKSVTRFGEVGEFADSDAGRRVSARIEQANLEAEQKLDRAGVHFRRGASYDTILGGFEVVVKAGEFENIERADRKSVV